MKPLKYRDLARMLVEAGFSATQGKGDHEKWTHPLLSRPVIITQTREIFPGVSRNAIKAIDEVKGLSNDRTR